MRVVIAPDSFKECATAPVVAEALARGIRRVWPEVDLELIPMADGGEGTVEALVRSTDGERVTCAVTAPLGDTVHADYGILGDKQCAVLEMAAASGLHLVPESRRDPRHTTTYGTGQLIVDALNRGIRRLIIGVGGSATNDGGAGMAQALGYQLRDATECDLPPGGAALAKLHRIAAEHVHPALSQCQIRVACDVTNLLCGPDGASAVYGPQKGATPEMIDELDDALRHFAAQIAQWRGIDIINLEGGGAAGGLAAGLVSFANAQLERGVDLVADACHLTEKLRGADLVITGEGTLDAQTVFGKVPIGVATRAADAGIPVIAVAGHLGEGYEDLLQHGVTAIHTIAPEGTPVEESIAHAEKFLANTAETIANNFTPT